MAVKSLILTLAQANAATQKLLVGAYLDSFSVTSVSVSLQFINPALVQRTNLLVDVDFTCPAAVLSPFSKTRIAEDEDFFVKRSIFISQVFNCIGRVIDRMHVEADGRLVLVIGDVSVELHVSADDWADDNSVWSVALNGADAHHSAISAISCIADESILFVAEC